MMRRVVWMGCLVLAVAAAASAEQFAKVGTFGGSFARIPADARGEALGLANVVERGSQARRGAGRSVLHPL